MRPRRTVTMLARVAVAGVLLAEVRPALAESGPVAPARVAPHIQLGTAPTQAEEEPMAVREWYGASMLTIDGFAFAALTGAFLTADKHGDLATWLAVAGVGGYLVGGPAVHFFERRFKMILASLGARIGAPLAGMLPGALIGGLVAKAYGRESDDGGGAFVAGLAFGFLGGMVVAAAVDDLAIARKPVAAGRTSVAILPAYHPATRQAGVMLRATW